MGMKKNLDDIYRLFLNDEELLRLLHYKPESLLDSRPDPLSETLPNILDIDDEWKIRDECIKLVLKDNDLVDKGICRIYLYAGRRRPTSHNYSVADQRIVIDIFCHEEYTKDLRLEWIGDRVNKLLVDSRTTGFKKINYVDGAPRNAPTDYVSYQHVYEIGSASK